MVVVTVKIVRLVFCVVTLWSLYMDMNISEEHTVLVFSTDVTFNMIRGSLFLSMVSNLQMTSVTTHRIIICEFESNMTIFYSNPKERDTLYIYIYIYIYIYVCVCVCVCVYVICLWHSRNVTHFYSIPTDGSLVMILLKICHIQFHSVTGYVAHMGKMIIHPKFWLENL